MVLQCVLIAVWFRGFSEFAAAGHDMMYQTWIMSHRQAMYDVNGDIYTPDVEPINLVEVTTLYE